MCGFILSSPTKSPDSNPTHKAGHNHCHATQHNQGVLLEYNYTEASFVHPFQASMYITLDISYTRH